MPHASPGTIESLRAADDHADKTLEEHRVALNVLRDRVSILEGVVGYQGKRIQGLESQLDGLKARARTRN